MENILFRANVCASTAIPYHSITFLFISVRTRRLTLLLVSNHPTLAQRFSGTTDLD